MKENDNEQIIFIKTDSIKNYLKFTLRKDVFMADDLKTIKQLNFDGNFNLKSSILNFKELNSFENLENLSIRNAEMNSDEWSHVCNLKKLKKLVLQNDEIENFDNILKINTLENFECLNSEIPNLEIIQNLKNLNSLTLGSLNLKDYSWIQNFTNLKRLNISFLNNFDMKILQNVKSLEKLSISKIPNIDFQLLEKLNIKEISLDDETIFKNQKKVDKLKNDGKKLFINDMYEI